MYTNNPEYKTIISGFDCMSREELSRLQAEMSLFMTLSELENCSMQFGKFRVHEITREELLLIDSLSANAELLCEKTGIESFVSETDYVNATYSDLAQKLSALGSTEGTATILDMLSCAPSYLSRAGKRVAFFEGLVPSCEENRVARYLNRLFYAKFPTVCTPNGASFSLYRKENVSFSYNIPKKHILAILAKTGYEDDSIYNNTPELDPESAMLAFCADAGIVNCIVGAKFIDERGLAPELLKFEQGVNIELSSFPERTGEPQDKNAQSIASDSFASIASLCAGSVMLIIPESAMQYAASIAKKYRLTLFAAGKRGTRGLLKVTSRGASIILLKQKLLSLLSPKLLYSAKAGNEGIPDAGYPVASHSTLEWSQSGNTYTGCNNVSASGFSVVSSAATLDSFPYLSAFYAVMGAYLKQVALGADKDGILLSLSSTFSASRSEAELGRTISAILGIYRAQAELSLPSQGSEVKFSDNTAGQITVFAAAKTAQTPIPARAIGASSDIYLLTPKFAENGMLDIADLKAMVAYFSHLLREGKVISSRVVCGQSVAAALCDMKTLRTDIEISDTQLASSFPHIALLVQTRSPIENGIVVAHTLDIPVIEEAEETKEAEEIKEAEKTKEAEEVELTAQAVSEENLSEDRQAAEPENPNGDKE